MRPQWVVQIPCLYYLSAGFLKLISSTLRRCTKMTVLIPLYWYTKVNHCTKSEVLLYFVRKLIQFPSVELILFCFFKLPESDLFLPISSLSCLLECTYLLNFLSQIKSYIFLDQSLGIPNRWTTWDLPGARCFPSFSGILHSKYIQIYPKHLNTCQLEMLSLLTLCSDHFASFRMENHHPECSNCSTQSTPWRVKAKLHVMCGCFQKDADAYKTAQVAHRTLKNVGHQPWPTW